MMLWFGMNIAIMIVITVSFSVIEYFFGIPISTYSWWYLWMFIAASIIGFSWSFLYLYISKWVAKKAYKIDFITIDKVSELPEKQKVVWDTVVSLSERNRINLPEVWIYQDNEPNAFATWRSKNSSMVCVSSWLLDIMDKKAIEWVVAHEMAHIINWDMVTMALLQWVLNTFVVFISNILTNIVESFLDEKLSFFARIWIVILFQLLLGFLASLVAMKFSRYREFRADECSARFVWKDKMLAWLHTLKSIENLIPNEKWSFATMKISTKTKSGFMSWLRSAHPDLDDRIKALEDLRI